VTFTSLITKPAVEAIKNKNPKNHRFSSDLPYDQDTDITDFLLGVTDTVT
jgi:hypothetical protein